MNEISEAFWMAISFIFATAALIAILSFGHVVTNVATAEQDVVDASILMNELRVYSPYNNTTISEQDIISLILQHEGSPFVIVVDAANKVDAWATPYNLQEANRYLSASGASGATRHTQSSHFDVSYLNANYFDVSPEVAGIVNRRGYYTASLIYDAGNAIVGVKAVFKSVLG